ncbi:MAG: hypothetical protein M1825_002269 [Sarcosagium campestre]|nr:MAG: hypothetical protein M1825_002269 [Sarcosagium campestre]
MSGRDKEYRRREHQRLPSPEEKLRASRDRSRSPAPARHHHHSKRHHGSDVPRGPVVLPYNSKPITKHEYETFKPLFALYLDIQKQIYLEDMTEKEARGRWKSFVGRWNRGELAEGWYDPSTLQKAKQADPVTRQSNAPDYSREQGNISRAAQAPEDEQSDDDDIVGPLLPNKELGSRRPGPSIPNVQDLVLKREMETDDRLASHEQRLYARKADRKQQKEQLDELVPRAEAGTRERQLEKKREVNDKMRSFREKSPGATEEVTERDLMGDDGVDAYRAQKKAMEKKKTDRELRKDEILRARAAERDEKIQELRAKEDKTMAMLKTLAKQNFG